MKMKRITPEQAAEIRSAAEKGDAKAQEQLGDLCRWSEGVRRDQDEAEKWCHDDSIWTGMRLLRA